MAAYHCLIALLTLYFANLIHGQASCGVACDDYNVELENAYNIDSENVRNIGGAFNDPVNTLNAMCLLSPWSNIEACVQCSKNGSGISNGPDLTLLTGWDVTCATLNYQGPDQAYACWQGLPGIVDACVLPDEANQSGDGSGGIQSSGTGGGMKLSGWVMLSLALLLPMGIV